MHFFFPRRYSHATFFMCCFLFCESDARAQPAGFTKLEIGASAPHFDLPGVDDKNTKLEDFADADILMVIFSCNHCPTAQAYEARINAIYEDYQPRGVAIVMISPNDAQAVRLDELGYSDLDDSLAAMKIRAREAGFKFPYLYDGDTQRTSLAFGVLATPHVFIFDKQRTLRYKGRIDDSEVKQVTSHDARNALDALLEGRPVPAEVTKVFGCSTKWSTKRQAAIASIEKWDQELVELSLIDAAGLKKIASNATGHYRLVNVWATWCAPCLAELPDLVTINRMYRKRHFELVTISVDARDAQADALNVLIENHVSGKNVLFDSDNRDALFEGLDPEWEGGLPYTVLIAPGGEIVYRSHGPFAAQELKRTIVNHLGRTYASRQTRSKPIPAAKPPSEKIEAGINFKTENLIAWCIVPFDARQRGPAERAAMVRRLGLRRVAYDWRKKNIPEFEEEILEYKKRQIEYFAFWGWHDSMEALIRQHQIRPQIWEMYRGDPPVGSDEENVAAVAKQLSPTVEKAKSLGLKFGLYNHGGWAGRPKNLVAVCQYLQHIYGEDSVGIVYNFHHGHDDVADFAHSIKLLKPYLLCLNLNGMADPDEDPPNNATNKILPIGSGVHEKRMIREVVECGYEGPIGVLGHRADRDAEASVGENIEGLKLLVDVRVGDQR